MNILHKTEVTHGIFINKNDNEVLIKAEKYSIKQTLLSAMKAGNDSLILKGNIAFLCFAKNNDSGFAYIKHDGSNPSAMLLVVLSTVKQLNINFSTVFNLN